ncbi:MAG TPA: toprim domain-containing protein [Oculatellaceae cyanobacterium]
MQVDELKRKIMGQARLLATTVAGLDPSTLSGKHETCPFPLHGGQNDFRFTDRTTRGDWICTCGHGDIFELVQRIRGVNFIGAAKLIDEALNGSSLEPRQSPLCPQPKPIQSTTDWTKFWAIQDLWKEAVPITRADPAWRYLTETRGIPNLDGVLSLKFHPCVGYKRDDWIEHFPTLLSAFSKDGKLLQLQRTALTRNGRKALPDKMLMPSWRDHGVMNGGRVKLHAITGDTLGLAEGVETALSAHFLSGGCPMWCTLTANLLKQVEVPESVANVWIFADNDETQTGQNAARELKARLVQQGKNVQIFLPSKVGSDFNDILLER